MIKDSKSVEEINVGNLFLRKISKQDAEFIFRCLNNKELTSYLSLGPLNTVEHAKRLIKSYLKYWDNYVQFNYIIELREVNDERIGSVSLWNINWKHQRAQVGIWLIPSFWNKGLGEETLIMIKNVGFHHLKINRLEAYIAVDNKRSISLFKKCGFKEEGILKQYLNFYGTFFDALILSCLKTQ